MESLQFKHVVGFYGQLIIGIRKLSYLASMKNLSDIENPCFNSNTSSSSNGGVSSVRASLFFFPSSSEFETIMSDFPIVMILNGVCNHDHTFPFGDESVHFVGLVYSCTSHLASKMAPSHFDIKSAMYLACLHLT